LLTAWAKEKNGKEKAKGKYELGFMVFASYEK